MALMAMELLTAKMARMVLMVATAVTEEAVIMEMAGTVEMQIRFLLQLLSFYFGAVIRDGTVMVVLVAAVPYAKINISVPAAGLI